MGVMTHTPNDELDLDAWIRSQPQEDLAELLAAAVADVPGMHEWVQARSVQQTGDMGSLAALVDEILKPSARFYDYYQSIDYANGGYDTVVTLCHFAHQQPTADLVPILERALTLTTRTMMKADDSSGSIGDLVYRLLEAHSAAVAGARPPLSQPEQTRLIKWMVKYRYGGKQDSFDLDIVAYAPGLSAKSIESYRKAISKIDLGEYGQYPLERLAVLDRDRDEIVATHGGEPRNELMAGHLVKSLAEAGLTDDARHYAQLGFNMASRSYGTELDMYLVDDAISRGDAAAAIEYRWQWFRRFPGSGSFDKLRETAATLEVWDEHREAAEQLLQRHDPRGYVRYLLGKGQADRVDRTDQTDHTDAAWDFALEHLDTESTLDADLWHSLCVARAATHPLDVLPVYEQLVTSTLLETDVRNYRRAAKLLKEMGKIAKKAGDDAERTFREFVQQTAERNRRRPRCIEILSKAKVLA